MMETISVIVTTYNSERTIDRALRSILNQQGWGQEFDLQLIVVDDCSTDRTPEIVRTYDVIFLSTEENSGGPNRGRNIGLAYATGDYLCVMDHDDEWMPHKIITQLPYLKRVPIVTCGFAICDESGGVRQERVLDAEQDFRYFGKNETFLDRIAYNLKRQNPYESGTIYWGASKNIPYEEYHGMVDFDRQLVLYHNRDSIEVCQPLFNRYVHDDNLSRTGKCWAIDGYTVLMAIGKYAVQHPGEARRGMKRVFGKLGRYYYLYENDMVTARFFFRKSVLNWKTLAFILTSFWGSKYVKKRMRKVTGNQ